MIEVVLDAELATDDLGHPSGRPDLTPKAKRLSTTGQQHRQLGELVGRESGRWTWRQATPQPCYATLPPTAYPLTHGALRHPERCGDLALLPTLLLQFPGTQPPPLAPVVGPSSGVSHTSPAADRTPDLATHPETFKSKVCGLDLRKNSLHRYYVGESPQTFDLRKGLV